MEYNKLVRDKIPERIKKHGDVPIIHVATVEEYEKALFQKIQEEVDEFLKESSKEEMADILEVLYAVQDLKGWSKESIEAVRQKKFDERGGFQDRIILDRTE